MLSPDVIAAEAAILTVITFFSGFAAQAIDRANDRALTYVRTLEEDLREALRYSGSGQERHLLDAIPAVRERLRVQPLERFVRSANFTAFAVMVALAIGGGLDASWHFSINIPIDFWILISLLVVGCIILLASWVHANTSREDLKGSVERIAPRMFSIIQDLGIATYNLSSVLRDLEKKPPGTARFWLGMSLVGGKFYAEALPVLKSAQHEGVDPVVANIGQLVIARAYEGLNQTDDERAELIEQLATGINLKFSEMAMNKLWPANWRIWIEAAEEAERRNHGSLGFGGYHAYVRRFERDPAAREAYAKMCESLNEKSAADYVRNYSG